jgi:glycosyltransferase involved in cell wall biosynthesis
VLRIWKVKTLMSPVLSLILPAHNESALVGACLRAVLVSEALETGGSVQIIVVPNGCTDDTADRAAAYADRAAAKGWSLEVIALETGGKLGALRAGDAAAMGAMRAYLDADVEIDPALLRQICDALKGDTPAYASGGVRISSAKSWITRAYARFYRQVPFMTAGVPGCGFFAMNASGHARLGDWPDIISDDTYARLSFTPEERTGVAAGYTWPLVEGFGALVRVRRRQNIGVDEITERYPALVANNDAGGFTPAALMQATLRAPFGFVIYASVSVLAKATKSRGGDWSRGR